MIFEINNKLQRFIIVLALVFIIVIIDAFFVMRLQKDGTYNGLIFVNILQFTLTILFFRYLIAKIPAKIYLFFILILGFLLRMWWINVIDTAPVSDFGILLNTAKHLANGDIEFIHKQYALYFYNYPYNIPFVIYEAVILKIFHSIWILKLLNVIYSIISIYLLYLISLKISNRKASLTILTIAAIFPNYIYVTSVLSNQILAFMLILTGIYLFFERKNLLLTGLFFAFAQIIRPLGIVFVIGMAGFILLHVISQHKNTFSEKIKKIFISAFQLFGTYYATVFIVFSLINLTGLPEKSMFHDPIPYYKFLVGLNHQSTGKANGDDAKLSKTASDFKKEALHKIKKRIHNKKALLFLFRKKINNFWGMYNTDMYWSYKGVKKANDIFDYYTYYLYGAMLVLSGFLLLLILFDKADIHEFIYYILIMLLLFGFIYLWIEIQARYRYSIIFIFIILSGIGADYLFKKLCK
jgi:hypothetical protein